MNLNTFFKRSPGYYKSGVCVYLKSSPGMGKTTTISAAVPHIAKVTGKRLGFSLINGANLTPPDTIGYLVPKTVTGDDGKPMEISVFTKPFWWFTDEGLPLDAYDGGVLFIDEADKAEVDLKKVIGEGAESGRFGPHRLPPGWVVWMAGNRSEDRSGSTKELDHLINRRMEIDITPDVASWESWAMQNAVPPEVITFAVQNPNIVFEGKVPDKQGPWCTPRSLVKTGRVLSMFADEAGRLPTDPGAMLDAAGLIGAAASSQLFATIKLAHELPSREEILNNPMHAKLPGKPDAQMLVCYSLAGTVDEDTIEPVVKYVERLPKEFSITFAKAACKRDPNIVNTRAIAQWCVNNASLMAAIADAR